MPDAAPASAQDAARETGGKAKATVTVDLDLCKACGICISLCPTKVFDRDDAGQAVVARLQDCTACRLCEWHCPDFAIEVLVERSTAPSGVASTEPEDA
jgi:2-oxoglutarate ferredoxin oxidoreductase subunit delta